LIRPILHLQPIPPSVIRPSAILASQDWKVIPALLPAIPVLKAGPDLMEWAMTVLMALVPVLVLMVSAAALMVPVPMALVAPEPAEVLAEMVLVPVLVVEPMVAVVPVRVVAMVLAAELMVAAVAMAATVADARLSHS
jgi:hypothetical protein